MPRFSAPFTETDCWFKIKVPGGESECWGTVTDNGIEYKNTEQNGDMTKRVHCVSLFFLPDTLPIRVTLPENYSVTTKES